MSRSRCADRTPPIAVALLVIATLGGSVSAPHQAEGASGQAPPRLHVDRARGISVLLPDGWRVAPASLTPNLSDPHEVISLGTGPLPAGGPCAQEPTRAILASAPGGAFVTLQERSTSDERFRLGDYPARPARWTLPASAAALPSFGCVGEAPVRVWWRAFRDGGRAFNLLVSVGRRAPPSVRREARAVVNSLRFSPGRTVGGGPWLRLPAGWDSLSYPRAGAQVLWASTAPLPRTAREEGLGAAAQALLGPGDVMLGVVRDFKRGVGSRAATPLRFTRSDFPERAYQGQAAAGLAARSVVVRGQALRVILALGPGGRPRTGAPSEQHLPPDADPLIARANTILRTLVQAPE